MVAPGALRVAAAHDPAMPGTAARQASYTVVLGARPTGTVTVTPVSSDPAVATVSGALRFTRSNWADPQPVTVTGVAAGRVGIAHRLTGGGYDGTVVPEVTVTVGDGGADPRKARRPAAWAEGVDSAATAPATDPTTDPVTDPVADPTTAPTADPVTEPTTAPAGALAALARGHLASARQVLGPRLHAGADAPSSLTLGGHTLSLARLLRPHGFHATFDPDAAPAAVSLSWLDATGRCASWTTPACGDNDRPGMGATHHGRHAGAWDTLLYRLATGVAGGGTDALWRGGGFALALGGAETGGRRWTLWGRHHAQAVAGLPAGAGFDSDLRTGYLGLDTAFGRHGRAGLAVSQELGRAPMRTVHPYLAWADGRTTVSALGGVGRGTGRDPRGWTPDSAERDLDARPLDLRLGRVEIQRQLGAWGGLRAALRAEAAWAGLRHGDGPAAQSETVRTLRLGLEAGGSVRDIAGITFTPTLQAHLRQDRGAGHAGHGREWVGALGAARGPLRLNVTGRWLATHAATAARERGLETSLALGRPGTAGLSLALRAGWGDAATGGETLWQETLYHRHAITRRRDWSLDARTELGLRLPGGRLFTGFASLSRAGNGPRALLGLQLGTPPAP